jgi:cytidyltransferase-like protein
VNTVLISASFDEFAAHHVRLLHEAARQGCVHVVLWSDAAVERIAGRPPKFPDAERKYLLEAIRYVDRVTLSPDCLEADALPPGLAPRGTAWIVDEGSDTPAKRAHAAASGLEYRVLGKRDLAGFPDDAVGYPPPASGRPNKRVIVTGCYDWFHSGHVRFFEEVAQLGELYVVVGHDANIRLLKGDGHPLFPQDQRRYMVQAVRFVHQALIASGDGWLDAEPEIQRLRPDIYAVNSDGDKPEKRAYCEAHGIEYRVLQRTPKEGLPRRQSTTLRGF